MYSVIRQLWLNLAIHTQLCHDKVVHMKELEGGAEISVLTEVKT